MLRCLSADNTDLTWRFPSKICEHFLVGVVLAVAVAYALRGVVLLFVTRSEPRVWLNQNREL